MKFFGLQKTTLLDYPGKVACTLFTGGCDFRCPFCHNSTLVCGFENSVSYSEDDILSFLEKRKGILEGVCITGGEPLLHNDILLFLRKVKNLGYPVKLDTNGSFYDTLKIAVTEKLVDFVAMDIKNSLRKYPETIGVSSFDTSLIIKSANFLMSGAVDFEFRTTVVKELHSESDFIEIGCWLKGSEKYFLQQYKDSGDILCEGMSACTKDEMLYFLDILRKNIPAAELRGVD